MVSESLHLTIDRPREIPLNSAVNAGSICPLDATSTARTTAGSMVGKASCKVAWACCWGDMGRGGFGGRVSVFKWGLGRAGWGSGLDALAVAVELSATSLGVSAYRCQWILHAKRAKGSYQEFCWRGFMFFRWHSYR